MALTMLAVGALQILLLWVACGVMFPYAGDDLPFDRAKWLTREKWQPSYNSGIKTVRSGMVEDLARNHLRKGMSRQEVLDLIGRPDRYNDQKSHPTWFYDVGFIQDLNFDPFYLWIAFDEKGVVEEFAIRES